MPKGKPGVLVMSLDFELFWGVRDSPTGRQYQNNLRGVPAAVGEILSAFNRASVHATWATVGFLFLKDQSALENSFPGRLPKYDDPALSPYEYIRGGKILESAFHFAPQLIEDIRNHEGQEIGTHTFSHFYCLEKGQDHTAFREDLRCALHLARQGKVDLRSFVFPRNQCNPDYLPILEELGISAYRGNEKNWAHRTPRPWRPTVFQRAFRFLDAYFNMSGHQVFDPRECLDNNPVNIPASRFLRPFRPKLAAFDVLRLKRITKAMDYAAAHQKIFHLWWHPHNFGIYLERNMEFLRSILHHYQKLREETGMMSLNMGELAAALEQERG